MLIISRIDGVHHKITSYRLVEIINKNTGNSYRDSETHLQQIQFVSWLFYERSQFAKFEWF